MDPIGRIVKIQWWTPVLNDHREVYGIVRDVEEVQKDGETIVVYRIKLETGHVVDRSAQHVEFV